MHGRPNRRNRAVFSNFSGLACTVGLTVEIEQCIFKFLRISVHGRPNRRSRVVFSNFSGLACTVGLTVEIELCFQISPD